MWGCGTGCPGGPFVDRDCLCACVRDSTSVVPTSTTRRQQAARIVTPPPRTTRAPPPPATRSFQSFDANTGTSQGSADRASSGSSPNSSDNSLTHSLVLGCSGVAFLCGSMAMGFCWLKSTTYVVEKDDIVRTPDARVVTGMKGPRVTVTAPALRMDSSLPQRPVDCWSQIHGCSTCSVSSISASSTRCASTAPALDRVIVQPERLDPSEGRTHGGTNPALNDRHCPGRYCSLGVPSVDVSRTNSPGRQSTHSAGKHSSLSVPSSDVSGSRQSRSKQCPGNISPLVLE